MNHLQHMSCISHLVWCTIHVTWALTEILIISESRLINDYLIWTNFWYICSTEKWLYLMHTNSSPNVISDKRGISVSVCVTWEIQLHSVFMMVILFLGDLLSFCLMWMDWSWLYPPINGYIGLMFKCICVFFSLFSVRLHNLLLFYFFFSTFSIGIVSAAHLHVLCASNIP